MPTSAALALQRAIYAALTGDVTLNALMGGQRIYDDVPQREPHPYVSFGQSSAMDWASLGEDGEEHTVTLHVWSRHGGKTEALAIMAAIRNVLHDAALTLDEHRLVNLRHEFSDVRREPDGDTVHGTVRYRAVTEPA
jgi:hypothetical protein